MPDENNEKSKEFDLYMDDEQPLMIAKKTYEHVKIIKEQEEK